MVQKPSGTDTNALTSANGEEQSGAETSANSGSLEQPEAATSSLHSSPHPSIVESFVSADDTKSSGQSDEAKEGSVDGSSIHMRSTSSKFANLRAAFERAPESTSSPGKRSFSGRSPSPRVSSGRWVDHENEIKRLREENEIEMRKIKKELEKERGLRMAHEEKYSALETEAQQLRQQAQERQEDEISPPSSVTKRNSSSDLQRQLSELKRNISKSTRIESQVADSTFVREIGVLHYEIQNWVVNNFRRPKTDMTPEQMVTRLQSIAEPEQMERLAPIYEAWEPSARLSIYQATAMCFIMEIFSENLLFGLPSQDPWRKSLRRTAETLPAILDPPSFNRWRSMTLEEIRQSPNIAQSVDTAANGMAEIICITLSIITEAELNDTMKGSLKAIILRVIRLAHLFRVQRPQYDFELPTSNTPFDSSVMEDIAVDSENAAGGTIRCATFPAIFKVGDEHGDHTHLRNVIVKAKVLCNDP